MRDEQVTPDFHLSEFLLSSTAVRLSIDNTPPPDILGVLRDVLIPSMQKVRDLLKVPIHIDSGYRCPSLNAAVNGAHNSDHMTGHAADFVAPQFGTPTAIARFLVGKMSELQFDQLILEGTWVHISFNTRSRNEVLTAHFSAGGRTTYTQGLA